MYNFSLVQIFATRMVSEPLRRLHCKTSRESLLFPIPLYSIYDASFACKIPVRGTSFFPRINHSVIQKHEILHLTNIFCYNNYGMSSIIIMLIVGPRANCCIFLFLGSFLPVLVILISWRLLVLLPVEKIQNKGAVADAEGNPVPNASMLPMSNMAMAMNAAAAGPISPISGAQMPVQSEFSGTGDKSMLY